MTFLNLTTSELQKTQVCKGGEVPIKFCASDRPIYCRNNNQCSEPGNFMHFLCALILGGRRV